MDQGGWAGRPDGGVARAALPLAVALLVAPAAGVLQSKALAPIAVVALLGCVVVHRREWGAWPWPRGGAPWGALGVALCLFGWAALTAAWAPEPWRALGTAVQIGGFVALGAAGARAVAAAGPAAGQRLLRAAAIGLAAGLALAAVDDASGNAIRAAVRGLPQAPPSLAFGLKPAASAMALWLPLLAAAPLPPWLRAVGLMAGAAVLVALPGEAAKLAVLAAGLAGGLAVLLPRFGPAVPGLALGAVLLVTPSLLGPVLARGIPAGGWPPSAAHRLLIWDFVGQRIAERPVFGWGMEASRQIPGHREPAAPGTLARFGLDGPGAAPWLPQAEMLPLHPHNLALQLRLELGWPGVLLAALLAGLLGLACRGAARPAIAAAVLAAGAVVGLLSFGAWQEWWIGAELLALAAVAALPRGAPGGA